MPNQIKTIRKFIKYLNNKNEQGGFWLPCIQRPFLWKKDQIERLYDSILSEYPIVENPEDIDRSNDLS